MRADAIETERRVTRVSIGERDTAETVRRSAQFSPGYEIAGCKNGVNARRSGDSKLKRAGQGLRPDQLNVHRVSDERDSVSPQIVEIRSECRVLQSLRQNQGNQRV